MEEDQIKCMKYAELQKLAKSVGIRANVKVRPSRTAEILKPVFPNT